jgi:hypothetical protein
MGPRGDQQRVVGGMQGVIRLRLRVHILDRALLVVILGDFAGKLVQVNVRVLAARKDQLLSLDPPK